MGPKETVMEKPKAKKIELKTQPAILKKNLESYLALALEQGAAAAVIVPASSVRIDERVRLKCRVPRCHLYGESPNCPPHTPPPAEMRATLKKYSRAVLFQVRVEPKSDFVDGEQWHTAHMKHQRKVHDIVSAVEAAAFNDGHYLAAGFGAGGCKTALCGGQFCQVFDSGRCRFPLKSRPSMEGVGIDVFRLVTEVGWDVYPVAVRGVDPDSIGCAISVGIVFIC
jgi:predicted metal-binding protein